MGPLHQCTPPLQMPVFNPPCIIKELQNAAHPQDTQTHTSAPSSILGAVYSNVIYIWLLMVSSRFWALTAHQQGGRGDGASVEGRKGKWPVSYFVDAKLTVPRRDEVSGMCVTVDCLTPEQLGICSGALVSFTHILCCQWGRSLVPGHKHSFRHCACERCRTVCVCVCLGFVSHLMTRPNRQGDSSSLIGGKCLRSAGSASGGSLLF